MPNRTVLSILLSVGCVPGVGASGLQCISTADIDPMESQRRYDPYEPCSVFPDHRSARIPPEFTVQRSLPLPSSPIASGVADDHVLENSPIAYSPRLFSAGEKLFEVHCAVCHGLLGDGDSVVARQMTLRPPPSLHERKIVGLSDGQLYRVIIEGYGLMGSYANSLDVGERWAVVAWVRALQNSRFARVEAVPFAPARRTP